MRAFLQLPGFRQLLEHEYRRPRARDPDIMTDVYDGSAWREFMGPPTSPCERIGLQGCTDGFQAHVSGSLIEYETCGMVKFFSTSSAPLQDGVHVYAHDSAE